MWNQNVRIVTLPADLRRQLTATEFNIIYLILDLSRITSVRSPSGAVYCYPSQKYIGRKIGRSREWISKCLQRLEDLGLVIITHRRKERGHWKTNLYRLGWQLTKILYGCKAAVKALLDRVKSSSHIDSLHTINQEKKGLRQLFNNKDPDPDMENFLTSMGRRLGLAG